jgi:hypothetical protein
LELASLGIQLPTEFEHYVPRIAKKNGKPKLDWPALDYHQKISQTGVELVSLEIIKK